MSIYGGDGSDTITVGTEWENIYAYGEQGDDVFYLPTDTGSDMYWSGGEGDDRWVVPDYENTASKNGYDQYHGGGKGDDLIYGTHKSNKSTFMWGEEGNDKLIAGDDVGKDLNMSGGHGDDKIYGGNAAGGNVSLYGDWHAHDESVWSQTGIPEFNFEHQEDWIEHYGDDVIMLTDDWYGDQIAVGGYGDDTILGANDSRGNTLTVFGDNKKVYDEFQDEDYDLKAGGLRDGADLIDVGDNNSGQT